MKAAQTLAKRSAIVFVASLSAAYAIELTVWIAHNPALAGMDFFAYWRAAHQSAVDAYAPGQSVQFPYMPTMLAWIAPLAVIPFWPAYLAFILASTLAFALASRPYLSRPQILLAIASPPIFNGLSVGQSSIALAAVLLWSCGARNRIFAGIALGLIASVKPQLVLMAPALLLVRRDWRAFWAAGFTWAATIVGSIALFGVGAWQAWFAALPHHHSVLMAKNRIGMAVAPSFAAQYLHWPPLPFAIAGIALALWLIWTARHSTPVLQCAAIACASLLSAPYAMLYDLAPIIPFLVLEIWSASIAAVFALGGILAPICLMLAAWRIYRVDRDASKRLPVATIPKYGSASPGPPLPLP